MLVCVLYVCVCACVYCVCVLYVWMDMCGCVYCVCVLCVYCMYVCVPWSWPVWVLLSPEVAPQQGHAHSWLHSVVGGGHPVRHTHTTRHTHTEPHTNTHTHTHTKCQFK